MKGDRVTAGEARDRIIKALMGGSTVKDAVAGSGRSDAWYHQQRRDLPDFAKMVDGIKLRVGVKMGNVKARGDDEFYDLGGLDPMMLSFPEFSEEYLGAVVPAHMRNVVDLIEGREPGWIHPAMTYVQGEKDLLLVNVPPDHAKTQTLSINYVTYRICMDPNIRVVIISKSQNLAKKILLAIKERLTDPKFARISATFGPAGGFDADAKSWTTEMIYVGGREAGEKDPTVQAIGIRGQLYGSRADLIICDDVVDSTNANDYDSQITYLQGMADSRLHAGGLMLLIGTRIAQADLYSEITRPELYPDEVSPWTQFVMPAVLEGADDPKDWVTLWPRTNMPPPGRLKIEPDEEGMYPKWDGPALDKKRRRVLPNVWSRIYMQQPGGDGEAIFPVKMVRACVNNARGTGRIAVGMPGVRPQGMEGLIVVAGLDPAAAGFTAATVVGLDTQTFQRFVIDVRNQASMKPDEVRAMVIGLTERYGIVEWVIERNALQTWIAYDREMTDALRARGCIIRPHFTGCVPTDVQALTRDGWKTHDQLSVGDLVLTDQGWQELAAVNVFASPGKLTRIGSRNVMCSFTDDHRHPVRWTGNAGTEDRFVATTELRTNTALRLTIPPVEGEGVSDDEAELLGWYLCEGSVHHGRNGQVTGASIYQSRTANPAKHARIASLLDRLGYRYSVYRQVTDQFYIHTADAKRLHRLAPGKRASVEMVASMSISGRERFMEACLLGDGHGETFFNTDLRLLEAFEAACALNGIATSTVERRQTGRFTQNRPLFAVQRKKAKMARPVHPQHPTMETVEYDGNVWCPTTPAGTWVAKSHGRVFLTGNSNKHDPDFGVAAMSGLFQGWESGNNLIELPATHSSEAAKTLVDQLTTWMPKAPRTQRTDTVMALWFAELACIERVQAMSAFMRSHVRNPFLTKADRRRQVHFSAHEAAEAWRAM